MAGTALAGDLAVTYFTVALHGNPDFNTTGCCVSANDLVARSLGPTGFPVVTAAHRPGGSSRYLVHDLNEHGELLWWSPRATVARTASATAAMPIHNREFFPPNGTGPNNSQGFQTATFKGVLHLPAGGRVTFRIGADDVALLYVDGTLVTGIAGVHPRRDAPVASELLPAGDHCLTLFYADLYRTKAELFLSIETPDVGLSAAPDTPADLRATPASCTAPVASSAGPAGVQYSALLPGIAGRGHP